MKKIVKFILKCILWVFVIVIILNFIDYIIYPNTDSIVIYKD